MITTNQRMKLVKDIIDAFKNTAIITEGNSLNANGIIKNISEVANAIEKLIEEYERERIR